MDIKYDDELKTIVKFVKGTDKAQSQYGRVVNNLLRQQYKADMVESIINNYLDDMTNEKHAIEFNELQAYRKECKLEAKKILGLK